jgi:hypothetical protein
MLPGRALIQRAAWKPQAENKTRAALRYRSAEQEFDRDEHCAMP